MAHQINPFSAPMTRPKIISFILYIIFFSASVWATAESIARTTHLPKVFCYIVSLAFLAGASFCLTLVKESLSAGYVYARTARLSVGIAGFLFLWVISFTSNTHNFYFVAAVDDLRRSDLGQVDSNIRLLRPRTELAGRAAKQALQEDVEAKLEALKSEIQNPGDPGAGKEAEKIVEQIEGLLHREVQPLDRPDTGLSGLRRYSDAMANQVRSLLSTRLREIDDSLSELSRHLSSAEIGDMSARLALALEADHISHDQAVLKKLLRSAFDLYNDKYELARQAFSAPLLAASQPQIKALPPEPSSISLENIASSWRNFLAGRFEPWKFWLSLLWAIALDLAAFILFYFGVLASDE